MTKKQHYLIFFAGIVLIFLGFFFLVLPKRDVSSPTAPTPDTITNNKEKTASRSGFPSAAEEIQKKEEEAKKKEDERANQAEESKNLMTNFGPCRNIPILIYHHVDNKPGSLYVIKEIFTQQMGYLLSKGYSTVTLVDVIGNLAAGKALPPKPVVVTFDDGYQDVYSNAYPILVARNLKATFFLITQLLGGGDYLTWQQVREMAANPLVTIGDHTLSHRGLTTLPEAQLKDEIISSKNILESNLKITVNVFAYPYGSYNAEAEKVLKEAGFIAAVTTRHGPSCAKLPYELRRIRIGNATLSSYGL